MRRSQNAWTVKYTCKWIAYVLVSVVILSVFYLWRDQFFKLDQVQQTGVFTPRKAADPARVVLAGNPTVVAAYRAAAKLKDLLEGSAESLTPDNRYLIYSQVELELYAIRAINLAIQALWRAVPPEDPQRKEISVAFERTRWGERMLFDPLQAGYFWHDDKLPLITTTINAMMNPIVNNVNFLANFKSSDGAVMVPNDLFDVAEGTKAHDRLHDPEFVARVVTPMAGEFVVASDFPSETEAVYTEFSSKAFVRLNNGVIMPALGFGTWRVTGDNCYNAVKTALSLGYRRIVTAGNYNNEADIGRAIADSDVPRRDIFLQTMVEEEDFGTERTLAKIERQLKAFQTTYIDLYLIHGPGTDSEENHNNRKQTWLAMEELVVSKKLRAIGVSNYDDYWLTELLKYADRTPAVVQNKYDLYRHGVHMHPSPVDMLDFCREHGIVLESYAPLSGWPLDLKPLDDAIVEDMANARGKTPAQMLIRWLLDQGIPMTTSPGSTEHMIENRNVLDFQLSYVEMVKMKALAWMSSSPLLQPEYPDVFDMSQYPWIPPPRYNRADVVKDVKPTKADDSE